MYSKKIQANTLITNSHAPTFPATIYSLKEYIAGVYISVSDRQEDIGSLLSDKHYTVSKEDDEMYVREVLAICKEEDVKVIVPLKIKERLLFLEHKQKFDSLGVKLFTSSAESITAAEDKVKLFELCKKHNILAPRYFVVDNYQDLKSGVMELGYPQKKVVVKPISGTGSRGLRILNRKASYKKLFYHTRADYTEITLSDLKDIIGKKFKPLIICEHLPGEEYTVDCLRMGANEFYLPRIRVEVRNGLTSVGKMEEHKEIIALSKKITHLLDLSTVFGFQFKLDSQQRPVIIDCNPRIQGTMIMSTLADANIIAFGVIHLLQGKNIKINPDWTMKYYRFSSGLSIGRTKKILNF